MSGKILTVKDIKEMGGRTNKETIAVSGNKSLTLANGEKFIPAITGATVNLVYASSTQTDQRIWIPFEIANNFYDMMENGNTFVGIFFSGSPSVGMTINRGSLRYNKTNATWQSLKGEAIPVSSIETGRETAMDETQAFRKDNLRADTINNLEVDMMEPIFYNIQVVGDGLKKSCNQMLCEGEVERILTDQDVYIEIISDYQFPSIYRSKKAELIGLRYQVNGENADTLAKSDMYIGELKNFTVAANNLLGSFKEGDIIDPYPVLPDIFLPLLSRVTVTLYRNADYTGTSTTITLYVDQVLSRNSCIVTAPESSFVLKPVNKITIYANKTEDLPSDEEDVVKYNLNADIGIRGAYYEAYFYSLTYTVQNMSTNEIYPSRKTIYLNDIFKNNITLNESIGNYPKGNNLKLSLAANIMVRINNHEDFRERTYYTTFDGVRGTTKNLVLNSDTTIAIDFNLERTNVNFPEI